MRTISIATLSSGMLMLAISACSTTAMFKEKAEPTKAAIQAAEGAGATSDANSAFYLRLAREEMDTAKDLFTKGKKKQGMSFLQRAEADAELARTVAAQDSDKTEAANATARVKQLIIDNPLDNSDNESENEGEMQ